MAGGDERFPVRRVYCVGRNYAAHAREMGFDPDREPPFFFVSQRTLSSGQRRGMPGTAYPAHQTDNYHYEIEGWWWRLVRGAISRWKSP